MNAINAALLSVFLLSFSMPVRAEPPHQPVFRTMPWSLSIEPIRRMRGEGLPWDHEIQIAVPPSYAETDKAYPVLWMTDGLWQFDLAVKWSIF